ncbi:hypothetical protein M422DRAFT_262151 [Sphaerobolus stellatus SS14]|uniref:SWIM-type domain-containing protein n=1 Tax=Sphaerobolus stellatus (strain SS14) TaxID=990650 RepID=A0A0C9UL06_SPHS4|nr:hypothetical protein M422DRAFT_262151 [Sphaerobolus stellatus SS14]
MSAIPPHPTQNVMQRGGGIQVELNNLYLTEEQIRQASETYKSSQHFHEIYTDTIEKQKAANHILGMQGLDVIQLKDKDLKDLGNRWSRHWSTKDGRGKIQKERVLLQCQCGSSSEARKAIDDAKKAKLGLKVNTYEWSRKMPYDFTGCLAHLDITYTDTCIIRITGIIEHNAKCEAQEMQRLPPVPLHPHVWKVSLKQINDGASITAIQRNNRQLCEAKFYEGQKELNAATANVRYYFLPQDSSRLYRMQARIQGVDLLIPPEQNIDAWLDPCSPQYHPELAQAIFHYKAREQSSECFKICIHTPEMKAAAWKYGHGCQLILDGTFGICDSCLLLFIGMAIDEKQRGVPIVFFLFSAPTGSQAMHAGYDTDILTELLRAWVLDLGKCSPPSDPSFCPKVAITDTDTKERGALIAVWPSIFLLLCKFHTRVCWSNKRKTLIKMGNTVDFTKQQIVSRIRVLDRSLMITEDYKTALKLTTGETSGPATNGLAYLDYLTGTWLVEPLWKSWSQYGRNQAAKILDIPIKDVAPTTNHLESFNGILKKKYIRGYQKGGRRIRFDLLIFLLVNRILPGIFQQRKAETQYYEWLRDRFSQNARGRDLDGETTGEDEIAHIVKTRRIGGIGWIGPYTMGATCASSLEDTCIVNHKRYTLYMNCYGWAACSCRAFTKYGHACKHLWALRFIISHMQTPHSFIYLQSEEQARQIYSTLFIPPTMDIGSISPNNPPKMVNHLLPPIRNHIGGAVDEIIQTFGEEEGNEVLDEQEMSSEEEFDTDNDDLHAPEDSKKAIAHQLENRLSHEVRSVLPKLHGIHSLLKETGSSLVVSPEVQELLQVSASIRDLLEQPGDTDAILRPSQGRAKRPRTPEKKIDEATAAPAAKRHLLPPSPERAQKRKNNTGIF